MADMEGTIDYNGRQVELADIDDWDFAEVAEAENAFGVDLDEARTSMRIMMGVFISIRRVEKSIPEGVLADQVRRMKFTQAITEKPADEEPGPLGETGNGHVETDGPADLPTTGSLHSAAGST